MSASRRAVYDTMVFFQWAVLPEHRQHRTVKALYDGSIRLCLSPELLNEIRDVLTRPELISRFSLLTAARVDAVLQETRKYADWFDHVPRRFSLPLHAKDNHLFDLAIEANADFLVTWEARLLRLQDAPVFEASRLGDLAPNLRIVEPKALAEILSSQQRPR